MERRHAPGRAKPVAAQSGKCWSWRDYDTSLITWVRDSVHGRELLRPCLARPAVFTPPPPPLPPPSGERFGWTRIGEDSKQAANDPGRERKREREREREYRDYYSRVRVWCRSKRRESTGKVRDKEAAEGEFVGGRREEENNGLQRERGS